MTVMTSEEFAAEVMKITDKYKDVPFKPGTVWYNKDGDLLEIYLTNDDYYGKWINHDLTLLIKDGTESEIVGFQITFVKDIMKRKEFENEP